MPTNEATTVVDQYYQRFNDGDLDGVVSLFADDYEGHWGLGSGGGGAATVRAHLSVWYEMAPDMQLDVTHTITDGSWVASFVVVRGTQTGAFMNVPPSGNTFQLGSVDMFRVEGANIVEGHTICDLGSLFIAAEAVPALSG